MVSLDVMVMEPADVNLSEEQYLQYFKQSSLEGAISYSNRSRALHVVHHTRPFYLLLNPPFTRVSGSG